MAFPWSNASKRCRGNCKQCRPWSDCSLIWVCTVCPDLSVRKLRKITVISLISRAQLMSRSKGQHTASEVDTSNEHRCVTFLIFRELPDSTLKYTNFSKKSNLPDLHLQFFYKSYTFFINCPEMKRKSSWCLFPTYLSCMNMLTSLCILQENTTYQIIHC